MVSSLGSAVRMNRRASPFTSLYHHVVVSRSCARARAPSATTRWSRVLAQLLDLVHRVLAFLVELVTADVDAVQPSISCRVAASSLSLAVHEFGRKSQQFLPSVTSVTSDARRG